MESVQIIIGNAVGTFKLTSSKRQVLILSDECLVSDVIQVQDALRVFLRAVLLTVNKFLLYSYLLLVI